MKRNANNVSTLALFFDECALVVLIGLVAAALDRLVANPAIFLRALGASAFLVVASIALLAAVVAPFFRARAPH